MSTIPTMAPATKRSTMLKKARSDKQKKILGILFDLYDLKGPNASISSDEMTDIDTTLRTANWTSARYMSQVMTKMVRKGLVVRVKRGQFKVNAAFTAGC